MEEADSLITSLMQEEDTSMCKDTAHEDTTCEDYGL